MSGYSHPVPLTDLHGRGDFDSGNRVLDSWFHDRALKNESSGASRTFVTTAPPELAVAGYYTLAASSIALGQEPGSIRRNMPDPIPVVLLGRLAVDRAHQGAGLGASLLRDAILRTVAAGDAVGVRALLVHAIDDEAIGFYKHFGFIESPHDGQTLFLPLSAIRSSLRAAAG